MICVKKCHMHDLGDGVGGMEDVEMGRAAGVTYSISLCIRLRDSTTRMLLQGQMLYPYDCNC